MNYFRIIILACTLAIGIRAALAAHDIAQRLNGAALVSVNQH